MRWSPRVYRLPYRPGTGYVRVAVRFGGVWGWFSPPIPEKDDLFTTVAVEMATRLFPNRTVCLVAAATARGYEAADLSLLPPDTRW